MVYKVKTLTDEEIENIEQARDDLHTIYQSEIDCLQEENRRLEERISNLEEEVKHFLCIFRNYLTTHSSKELKRD